MDKFIDYFFRTVNRSQIYRTFLLPHILPMILILLSRAFNLIQIIYKYIYTHI